MALFFCLEINALVFTVFFLFTSLMLNAFNVERPYSFFLILVLVFNLFAAGFFFPSSYVIFANFIFESTPSVLLLKFLLVGVFLIFWVFILLAKFQEDEFDSERAFLYLVIFTAGLFLSSTKDPLTIFIFIEIVSLASFGLIALAKTRYSYEAATKYLIFSSIASCFFIMSYLCAGTNAYGVDTGLLNHYALYFPTTFNTAHATALSETLLAFAFFIKFGLGPFSGWLVDAYEAAKYRDFVFLSTAGKLPMVIAFAQVFTNISQDFTKYFFISFLFCFAISASVFMVRQKKIRRFFAYSGLFNYALGFILFFASAGYHFITVKYFLYYTVIALVSYIAFDLYRAQSTEKKEPVFIEELGKFSQTAPAFCFSIAIIINSGLPPLGIFLMKAFTFGFLIVSASYTDVFTIILISLFFLVLSMINIFAYFKIFSNTLSFQITGNNTPFKFTNPQFLYQVTLFFVSLILFVPINYYWMYFIR